LIIDYKDIATHSNVSYGRKAAVYLRRKIGS